MATAMSVKNGGQQLSCSICQQTSADIIVSSCFHTFCRDCLKSRLQSSIQKLSHYECPICKTSINLPLNTNWDLNSRQSGDQDGTDVSHDLLGSRSQSCDICSPGNMAVNRCLQCEENFCDTCTNAHLKMKASRYHGHRVVPLSGHGQHNGGRSKSDMVCPRHRNEEIIVVCKQCNVMLCLVCKLLEHENHVTKLVSEEAEGVRNDLSTLLQQQTGYSENLQMRVQMLNSKKLRYPRDLEQELTKVRHQASKLHFEIEKEKTDTEQDLIKHYNGYMNTNQKSYADAKHEYEAYISMSTEAQRLLDSDNDVDIIDKGGHLYEELQSIKADNNNSQHYDNGKPFKKFVPSRIDEQQMQHMMGYLSDGEENHVKSSPSLSLRTSRRILTISEVASFKLPSADGVGYVYGIAPIAGQQAWITMLDHKYVTLVDTRGNSINKVEVGVSCDGVTSDGIGGCFVTCPGDKSIKRLTSNGVVTTMCQLSQSPHGIAAFRHLDVHQNSFVEELYVCITDNHDLASPMTRTQNGNGCVKIFSFSGHDLEIGFFNQSPVRVGTSKELVCVSDHMHGCVTVYDKSDHVVRALYTGEGRQPEMFKPLGVCFDKFGHVIIADWKGDKVRRISQDGVWIQDLVNDIDGPQTVAIGDDGLLWIGGKQGNIHVYRID